MAGEGMMPTFQGEVQLMAWGDSHTSGPWVKLRLQDSEALEAFRGLTAAKAGIAGHRLACVLVEISDQETPVEHKKHGAGPLCTLAARWCKDEMFQTWLAGHYPDTWRNADAPIDSGEEIAADCVRCICGVKSRVELDLNPNAGRTFHKMLREPFHQWLGEQGA